MNDQPEAPLMRRYSIHFGPDTQIVGIKLLINDRVLRQVVRVLGKKILDIVEYNILTLTVADAAALAKEVSALAERTSPDWEAADVIYGALVYGVFNVFWDDGLKGALAGEESW